MGSLYKFHVYKYMYNNIILIFMYKTLESAPTNNYSISKVAKINLKFI